MSQANLGAKKETASIAASVNLPMGLCRRLMNHAYLASPGPIRHQKFQKSTASTDAHGARLVIGHLRNDGPLA